MPPTFPLFVVVLYAVTAVYFAGVMVRLMLTLTPIVVILASIAISHTLDNYMKPVFSQNKDGELTIITGVIAINWIIIIFCVPAIKI